MPSRLPPDTKRRCIRLRLDEQLSAPAIARRLGISNTAAYKALEKHAWLGKREHHRAWSDEEVRLLEELWPKADEPDLLAALPKRNLAAIGRKACSLGIRRRFPGSRKNERFIHPMYEALRRERERRGWTRKTLGKKAGYHWNLIQAYENGKAQPRLTAIIDWAAALGFRLTLEPIVEKDAPFVSAPSRERLMSGR